MENRKVKQVLSRESGISGRGQDIRKVCRSMYVIEISCSLVRNAKMKRGNHSRNGGRRIKENDRG
jgi:hypothetical protein